MLPRNGAHSLRLCGHFNHFARFLWMSFNTPSGIFWVSAFLIGVSSSARSSNQNNPVPSHRPKRRGERLNGELWMVDYIPPLLPTISYSQGIWKLTTGFVTDGKLRIVWFYLTAFKYQYTCINEQCSTGRQVCLTSFLCCWQSPHFWLKESRQYFWDNTISRVQSRGRRQSWPNK